MSSKEPARVSIYAATKEVDQFIERQNVLRFFYKDFMYEIKSSELKEFIENITKHFYIKTPDGEFIRASIKSNIGMPEINLHLDKNVLKEKPSGEVVIEAILSNDSINDLAEARQKQSNEFLLKLRASLKD